MSKSQLERVQVKVECLYYEWGWKSRGNWPRGPCEYYHTILGVKGFRVNNKLVELVRAIPLGEWSEHCRHVKSEISLCPVDYYECREDFIEKYLK
jgi:hypothetical protein